MIIKKIQTKNQTHKNRESIIPRLENLHLNEKKIY